MAFLIQYIVMSIRDASHVPTQAAAAAAAAAAISRLVALFMLPLMHDSTTTATSIIRHKRGGAEKLSLPQI